MRLYAYSITLVLAVCALLFGGAHATGRALLQNTAVCQYNVDTIRYTRNDQIDGPNVRSDNGPIQLNNCCGQKASIIKLQDCGFNADLKGKDFCAFIYIDGGWLAPKGHSLTDGNQLERSSKQYAWIIRVMYMDKRIVNSYMNFRVERGGLGIMPTVNSNWEAQLNTNLKLMRTEIAGYRNYAKYKGSEAGRTTCKWEDYKP